MSRATAPNATSPILYMPYRIKGGRSGVIPELGSMAEALLNLRQSGRCRGRAEQGMEGLAGEVPSGPSQSTSDGIVRPYSTSRKLVMAQHINEAVATMTLTGSWHEPLPHRWFCS